MSTDSHEREAPRLLDHVRELIRIRHHSIRTEQALCGAGRATVCFTLSSPNEVTSSMTTASAAEGLKAG